MRRRCRSQRRWLDSSPTFHSGAVSRLIKEFKPSIVIFDNAGRTAQLRAAHGLGARIVFISSRSRQRRKAFRWRWMRLLDEHWIAYPQLIAGELGWLEQFKLKRLGRPTVRYLDVILSRKTPEEDSIVARVGLKQGGYLLIVPGGGNRTSGCQRCGRAILGGRQFAGGNRNRGVCGSDASGGRRRAVAPALGGRGHAQSPVALLQFAAAGGSCGTHEPCTARRHEWRLHAAAGHRLRMRLHRGADCARSAEAHSALRGGRRRGGRGPDLRRHPASRRQIIAR